MGVRKVSFLKEGLLAAFILFFATLVFSNCGGGGGGVNAIKTAPSAPQNLTAKAGDGQVTLNWSAPADSGGSAITGYNI